MWKISLVLVGALAACSTGGGSAPTPAPSPYAPVSVETMAGTPAVTISGPTMGAYNGYDVPLQTQTTVQFVSPTQINVNGIALTGGNGVFTSSDGTLTLTVSNTIPGVSTDQILYMLATQSGSSPTTLSPLVTGNATAAADLPKTGTATYATNMTLYSDLGVPSSSTGPTLTVNFDSAKVTGNFTFAKNFVQLASTDLTNGSFSTTLTSPEVTGTINGTLYGQGASEVGGTLSIAFSPGGTPSSSEVGYYGGVKQSP